MSKVLIDVTPLLPEKITGIGAYTKQLFKTVKALGYDVSAVYRGSKILKENNISAHINQSGKALFSLTGSFYGRGTIAHTAAYSFPSTSTKFKRVLSIVDLAIYRDNIVEPAESEKSRKLLEAELDRNPAKIIVPTEFIKGEFLTRFPKFEKKVVVIPHGCDHLQDTMVSGKVSSSKITKNPFFLYVGSLEKRKNLVSAIRAFNSFCDETPNVDFIIVGREGYGAEAIRKAIQSSPYRRQIHQIGYVGPGALKGLYQQAVAFIYPSFYEGFGMPVVEAMKLGAPIIASNAGATAEIAAGFSHQIDPKEPEEINLAMNKIFHGARYRNQLKEAAIERGKEFSWVKTARKTIDIYNQI